MKNSTQSMNHGPGWIHHRINVASSVHNVERNDLPFAWDKFKLVHLHGLRPDFDFSLRRRRCCRGRRSCRRRCQKTGFALARDCQAKRTCCPLHLAFFLFEHRQIFLLFLRSRWRRGRALHVFYSWLLLWDFILDNAHVRKCISLQLYKVARS